MSATADDTEIAAFRRFQRFLAFEKMEKEAKARNADAIFAKRNIKPDEDRTIPTSGDTKLDPGRAGADITLKKESRKENLLEPVGSDRVGRNALPAGMDRTESGNPQDIVVIEIKDEDSDPEPPCPDDEESESETSNCSSEAAQESEEDLPSGAYWRKDLNRRMGCTSRNDIRERRGFVLSEAKARGLALDRRFSSYPFDEMRRAVEDITEVVRPKWGWDRTTIKDCIRALCLDRAAYKSLQVRRSIGKQEKAFPLPWQPTPIEKSSVGSGEVRDSRSSTLVPQDFDKNRNSVPKNIEAQSNPERNLPYSHPNDTNSRDKQTSHDTEPRHEFSSPKIGNGISPDNIGSPIPKDVKNTFHVKVIWAAGHTNLWIPLETSFRAFNKIARKYSKLQPGEFLYYSAQSGGRKDMVRRWFLSTEDYRQMLCQYANVGVIIATAEKYRSLSPEVHEEPIEADVLITDNDIQELPAFQPIVGTSYRANQNTGMKHVLTTTELIGSSAKKRKGKEVSDHCSNAINAEQ